MKKVLLQFKALGDENRFRIFMMLRVRSLCVCEILEVLDIAGGTLSNHLKILHHAGLIHQKREGRWIVYFLVESIDQRLLAYIDHNLEDPEVLNKDRDTVLGLSREVCSASRAAKD
ncbi:MAG: winged helix-turn-helix transcriptional regulator [Bacteroidetes bacterium]|nr:winged helix-turn-helix transcriptional regulator [Bacteroidota bacterium]